MRLASSVVDRGRCMLLHDDVEQARNSVHEAIPHRRSATASAATAACGLDPAPPALLHLALALCLLCLMGMSPPHPAARHGLHMGEIEATLSELHLGPTFASSQPSVPTSGKPIGSQAEFETFRDQVYAAWAQEQGTAWAVRQQLLMAAHVAPMPVTIPEGLASSPPTWEIEGFAATLPERLVRLPPDTVAAFSHAPVTALEYLDEALADLLFMHEEALLRAQPRPGHSNRHLAQISGSPINAISGIVQRNIEFNCSTLSGLEACAETLCADVFSLVRAANGTVSCLLTNPQTNATTTQAVLVRPYAYDYFFNFVNNVALFGFSAGLDLQNVVRARTREPSGNDFYNYNILTFNARSAAGSWQATDFSNVDSVDAPYVQFGVNTVQPFTYNTRMSPYNRVSVRQRREVAPGFVNNLLAVLAAAQYTVFGNSGLSWLP